MYLGHAVSCTMQFKSAYASTSHDLYCEFHFFVFHQDKYLGNSSHIGQRVRTSNYTVGQDTLARAICAVCLVNPHKMTRCESERGFTCTEVRLESHMNWNDFPK